MGLVSKDRSGPHRATAAVGGHVLDHDAIDWSRIRRGVYDVHQRFRYVYAAPIAQLRQRLIVVPRLVHGDQRLRSQHLRISEPRYRKRMRIDRFGNIVVQVNIPNVEESVDFEVSLIVERSVEEAPHVETGTSGVLEAYLRPSALTRPDAALRAAAGELARTGARGADLVRATSRRVHQSMAYGFDRTGVRTTAGEALATGQGVCQDYAHVMVALCRLLGLPARYVSGHLVGEGGTHAWVEVLLPASGQSVEIVAWDPTHDRRTDLRYLTVSVGRDYRDVAPASGTYCAPHSGWLLTSRRVAVTEVEREVAA